MPRIYENSYIVNSFHAVNADTKAAYTPDNEGFIKAKAGDKIIFESPYSPNNYISLNTLMFFTKDKPLKVYVNPSDTSGFYPLYVKAHKVKGIQYMRIDSITVLNDCDFYYEGLAC